MFDEYIELIWFFIGIFAYRLVTSVLSYSHMALTMQGINEQILKMLGTVAEDIGFIRAIKYVHMADSGLEEEQIVKIKELDNRSFFTWKNMCIGHILTNCPKSFRGHIKYYDWNSAMDELDRLYKVEGKKNKS